MSLEKIVALTADFTGRKCPFCASSLRITGVVETGRILRTRDIYLRCSSRDCRKIFIFRKGRFGESLKVGEAAR